MASIITQYDCGHDDCLPPHGRLPSDLVRDSFHEAALAIRQVVGDKYDSLSYEAIGFLISHVNGDGGVLVDQGIWDEDGNYDPETAEIVAELEKAGALVKAGRGWALPCVQAPDGYERPMAIAGPRKRLATRPA